MRCELREDKGKGPVVVYVPGIDGSGELLLGTAERLEQRFRLVQLRHLADDSPDSYPHPAGSIVDVLDHLEIADAMLLAESFGGAVALQCALDHPDRVRSLAIVNSFAWFPKRAFLAWSRMTAPLVPHWLFRRARPWVAPTSLFGRRREQDAIRRFVALDGVAPDEGYRRRLRMIRDLNLRPRLAEIRQPVALFAADRDRIVPSLRCARELQEHIPHASLEVIHGGGHLILPLRELPWVEWLEALEGK